MRRLLVFFSLLLCAPSPGQAVKEPRILADQVYGHKDGMALTLDVIRPTKPNGAGILMIQSGGWYSNWVDAKNWLITVEALRSNPAYARARQKHEQELKHAEKVITTIKEEGFWDGRIHNSQTNTH